MLFFTKKKKEKKKKKNRTIVIERRLNPNFGRPTFGDWLHFHENKLGMGGAIKRKTEHWREVPFPFPSLTPERLYNEIWFDLFFVTCFLWFSDINTAYEYVFGSSILEWLTVPNYHAWFSEGYVFRRKYIESLRKKKAEEEGDEIEE